MQKIDHFNPIQATIFLISCFLIFVCPSNLFAENLIERIESKYNTIFIYKNNEYVKMTFGYNKRIFTESISNTKDRTELPVIYTRYMTAGLAYAKNLKNILDIGFGGGTTAWYMHRYLPRSNITSVELDERVFELSQEYFGIQKAPNFNVRISDGRMHLMRSKKKYDVIMIDAYRGPFVPFHLMTKEFYEIAKARMQPGGALIQNVEPTTMLFEAAVATLQSVFDQVEFYAASGNVVTIAYDGFRRSKAELEKAAKQLQKHHNFRYQLPKLLKARRFLGDTPSQGPLTDDFAPVETLRSIERHNAKWLEK
ncbi:MAG: spermidine synthase [Rickettsiales bacterium]|nr:spermidine synthase [Rickettsiales bacterium]